MYENRGPSLFWTAWLLVVSAGVALFGLLLVLLPDLAQQGFALLIYQESGHLAGFGADAAAYISLAHAVLGSVMFGWGIALFLLICGLFRQGDRHGWALVMVSVTAWFLPDTAFSLWSGFWPNAVLNIVFMALFVIPLSATYKMFYGARP